MPFSLLHQHLPEIAARETRTIEIRQSSDLDLPPDVYAFMEMFCDEPDCDCRRAFFFVVSEKSRDVLAVINWGWEKPKFYAKWMKMTDRNILKELMGPALVTGRPQSPLAPALLRLFKKKLLTDAAYLDRVKEHYRLFREAIPEKA